MRETDIRDAVARLTPDLTAFLQDLVRIPSLPGQEAAAHGFVADAVRAMGLEVDVLRATRDELAAHPAFSDDGIPIEPRVNVVGTWRARKREEGARSIILNGHLDVVSPGNEALWSDSPWSGRLAGSRVYGRGSCDMKAGVTSAVFAVKALQALGLAPGADVLVETVSGEESGGIGTLTTIVRGYRADAAIILEPTALALCPVQAGALTFRLAVPGRSAHAALKRSGVSAIDKLRLLLDALDRLERDRHAARSHPLYADPQQIAPISVGTLHAGEWHSTVPGGAVAEGRFGVFPGENVPSARRAFEDAIARAAQQDEFLRANPPRLEWFEGQFESGETPIDAPIVRTVSAKHRQVTGHDPHVEGVTYGSDLRLFTNHAHVPTVLYGPGDVAQAHTTNEYVELDQVVAACTVVALAIADWCRCA